VRDLSARRERERQQKRFASMLSHEFRTPLSTIDGAVQRLEMTGAHHDEGTRKRYRKIQAAVDRMLAMLDEYLSPDRMASIGRTRQPTKSRRPRCWNRWWNRRAAGAIRSRCGSSACRNGCAATPPAYAYASKSCWTMRLNTRSPIVL
jgi:hypothetical protein